MATPLRRRALILLPLALLGAPPADAAGAAPELVVEAPPELAAEARRIRQADPRSLARLAELVGLRDPGGPIRVVLAGEGSPAAEGAPDWVSGWAWSALGTVVLLPEREPSYPAGSLDELLRHEVAHVLIHRAAGGQAVPRWFNEGVAMTAAGAWGLDDRSRLTLALLFDSRAPIARLDARFAGKRGEVLSAYAVSGAMVREIVRHFGDEAIPEVLGRLRLGLPFDEAFRRTAGVDLATFEAAFWRRYSIWYRWLPIVTSSFAVWIGVLLVALWAGAVRRRRRAEIEARWEAEEAAAGASTAPGDEPIVH